MPGCAPVAAGRDRCSTLPDAVIGSRANSLHALLPERASAAIGHLVRGGEDPKLEQVRAATLLGGELATAAGKPAVREDRSRGEAARSCRRNAGVGAPFPAGRLAGVIRGEAPG